MSKRGCPGEKAVRQSEAIKGKSENPETELRSGRARPPLLHTAPQVTFLNRTIEEYVAEDETP